MAINMLKKVNTPKNWEKFRKLRNKSISALREAKKNYKIKLSEKITSGKISSKDWWKTIKTLLDKDKMDDIPPLI